MNGRLWKQLTMTGSERRAVLPVSGQRSPQCLGQTSHLPADLSAAGQHGERQPCQNDSAATESEI